MQHEKRSFETKNMQYLNSKFREEKETNARLVINTFQKKEMVPELKTANCILKERLHIGKVLECQFGLMKKKRHT